MTKGKKFTEEDKFSVLHVLNREVWATTEVVSGRSRLPYWSLSHILRLLLAEGRVERRKAPYDTRKAEWRLADRGGEGGRI